MPVSINTHTDKAYTQITNNLIVAKLRSDSVKPEQSQVESEEAFFLETSWNWRDFMHVCVCVFHIPGCLCLLVLSLSK